MKNLEINCRIYKNRLRGNHDNSVQEENRLFNKIWWHTWLGQGETLAKLENSEFDKFFLKGEHTKKKYI